MQRRSLRRRIASTTDNAIIAVPGERAMYFLRLKPLRGELVAARLSAGETAQYLGAHAALLSCVYVPGTAELPSECRVTPFVAGIAVLLEAAFLPLHIWSHDSGVRRRFKRFLADQLGANPNWFHEVELHPEGVWSRGCDVELMLGWKDSTGIEDASDAVEMHFRSGIAVVRNRAFSSPLDRERFLATARRFASSASPARTD